MSKIFSESVWSAHLNSFVRANPINFFITFLYTYAKQNKVTARISSGYCNNYEFYQEQMEILRSDKMMPTNDKNVHQEAKKTPINKNNETLVIKITVWFQIKNLHVIQAENKCKERQFQEIFQTRKIEQCSNIDLSFNNSMNYSQ